MFHKIGAFGEYKLNEALGLQTALLHCWDYYFMKALEGDKDKHALVIPRYTSMPVILRAYPGADRQFCIFGGLQVGYLIGGKYFSTDIDNLKELMKQLEGKDTSEEKNTLAEFVSLKDEEKVGKFAFHLVMGFDYESDSGFISGLEISRGAVELNQVQ